MSQQSVQSSGSTMLSCCSTQCSGSTMQGSRSDAQGSSSSSAHCHSHIQWVLTVGGVYRQTMLTVTAVVAAAVVLVTIANQ